jgi:N-acetylglucosaminyldiphosphoundecaprenol N-acetyl-beta-D-mannosaminyltransferase
MLSIVPQQDRAADIARADDLDDLSRAVYCILGIPVDAIEMPAALRRVGSAAEAGVPYFISTPNLNFLVNSRTDVEFRESLLQSDLCPADGMPIVWLGRLVGAPINGRVAGSDIFEGLKRQSRRLKIFVFGGAEGVAAAACRTLNAEPNGLVCVGAMDPGFGSVDDLSQDQVIETINSSRADFLVAALGAKKGQLWLRRNHHRLQIPIRAHLGATINFQANTVRRAPFTLRRLGFEWLWRIKEEPYLWKRYWNDGVVLLSLLLKCVLPLAMSTLWQDMKSDRAKGILTIPQPKNSESVFTLSLIGSATARNVPEAVACFRAALSHKKHVAINLSETFQLDARFLGLLFMLRKCLKENEKHLTLFGASTQLKKLFRLNGAEFLLPLDQDT